MIPASFFPSQYSAICMRLYDSSFLLPSMLISYYCPTTLRIAALIPPAQQMPAQLCMALGWYNQYSNLMSQFLKENLYSPKHITENRVLMLAQKINSLNIGHRAQAERKLDTLEQQVAQLEAELERITVTFNGSHYDLKHIFSKIAKELAFDHPDNDSTIRAQIQSCQQLAIDMIAKQVQERKNSDSRISRFIDQKCALIRDLIEKENKERSNCIKEIEDSLSRGLTEIRDKLQADCSSREQRIELIHAEFLTEYEKMQAEFSQLAEKFSDSEAEFYKMLRDVLKKVKAEIAEGHRERQEMEESILVLIERICDKAMEEAQLQ